MGRKVIIQFGRLDSRYRNKITFAFEGIKGGSELSGLFLKNNVAKFKDAERLLIFPSSIIFQPLNNMQDKFINKVINTDPLSYLKSPSDLLYDHPHVSGADVLVVSSMGQFKFRNDNDYFVFGGTMDTITMQLYSYLIKNYSNEDFEDVYIDVSSGQNIYIASLINAIYRFLPFVKFNRYLFSSNDRIKAYLLNSDPIVGEPSYPIKIQQSKFSAKAFNSFPYKDSNELIKVIEMVFAGEESLPGLMQLINTDYFLLHGALIYGCPLMITMVDFEVLENIFESVGIENILSTIQNHFANKGLGESFKNGYLQNIFSLTFALAISKSIYFHFKKVIQEGFIEFNMVVKKKKEYSLKNDLFAQTFSLLKATYDQPVPEYIRDLKLACSAYLEKEIDFPEGFISFSEFNLIVNPDYKTNAHFEARNYFAHGGFEKNITEVKVENRILFVRYNKEIVENNLGKVVNYLKK